MARYTDIIRSLSAEKFSEVLSASSRQARETYFHRHDVRAPKLRARIPKPGAKNEARIAKLYEVLGEREDEEMAEEILRNWLLTKRAMLVAALDHLGIEHSEGLTESDDIEKIEKLGKKEVADLATAVEKAAPRDDVAIYLKFMGAEKVDEALGA